jgi:hypothetical protein
MTIIITIIIIYILFVLRRKLIIDWPSKHNFPSLYIVTILLIGIKIQLKFLLYSFNLNNNSIFT